jgi:REP element-mobilizing transposase RayT
MHRVPTNRFLTGAASTFCDHLNRMLDEPVYFLTWTTYGSWLPGDDRGWVDAATSGAVAPINRGDATRLQKSRAVMRAVSVFLDDVARRLVEQTIREVCTHSKWHLFAVNARSNHVHVVVRAAELKPERVMNALKSWCSRRLNEHHGTNNRWWTRHGSTRWINREDDLNTAIHYVNNQQDGERFTSRDRKGAVK